MEPNPNQVSVRQGQDFEVRLPAAPATGYIWQLKSHPARLEPLDSAFDRQAEEPPAVGGAGEQRFRFRALEAGSYEIAFELRRPWESTAAQTRTFHVHVAP